MVLNNMNLMILLFCLVCLSEGIARPNIIVFVIDDMPFLEEYSESAPIGVDLVNHTVEYEDYPTPNINAFRNESVIFPMSYCGGSKCAPSRYSLLTGRQPSRSEWAAEMTMELSGNSTDSDTDADFSWLDLDSKDGTYVIVDFTKLSGYDTIYNLPHVLHDNGYHTGTVGKWHLMPQDDNGHNIGCSFLEFEIDADLYSNCTEIVKESGFDFVDAWYYSNVQMHQNVSHNPEWMVSQSQKFIDESITLEKPFFLYFASTLVHGGDSMVFEALTSRTFRESPKGTLFGEDVPNDTAMRSRERIWSAAVELAEGGSFQKKMKFAKYLWVDESFGALIEYLEERGIYDDTLIVLQSDHGQEAKGLLYQHGSRILNFVRYPALFGAQQSILSTDFVVSNVDLAITIFDAVNVTKPAEYIMDGVSWLDDVVAAIEDPESAEPSCCDFRFIDIRNSRSIVSRQYQYIWRANEDVEGAQGVDDLYDNAYDLEQLYDLEADPDQETNLIERFQRYCDLDNGSLAAAIDGFEGMMREYINTTCPLQDGQCAMPSFMRTLCEETVGQSLADCKAVAAQFRNTCDHGDYDTAALDVASMPSETVQCSGTGRCIAAGHWTNGSNTTCEWDRKLCVTCHVDEANTTKIRIQTNNLPDHCIHSQLAKELDFDYEVNFNTKESPRRIRTEFESQEELDDAVCPIVKSYGRPRLGIIEYGADVADSQWVMATAINGVAFQFANTIDEDPMFPMSVDNEQPLDICLGHNQLNADSGMYHYHGISPCINQQFLRRKEMDACNGNRECSNDLVEWMLSGFRDTVFYSNKTVIGLSKFGHVLYGPYNDYGELWDVEDVDACNGVWSGDRSQYFYVGTRWHPYAVGCEGPANSPHNLRRDSFYPNCSLNGIDQYADEFIANPVDWTADDWIKVLIVAVCAFLVTVAICMAVFVEWKFKLISSKLFLKPTSETIELGQVVPPPPETTPPPDLNTTGTAGVTFCE